MVDETLTQEKVTAKDRIAYFGAFHGNDAIKEFCVRKAQERKSAEKSIESIAPSKQYSCTIESKEGYSNAPLRQQVHLAGSDLHIRFRMQDWVLALAGASITFWYVSTNWHYPFEAAGLASLVAIVLTAARFVHVHSTYESALGIPDSVAAIEHSIYEGLDSTEAENWAEQFFSAIPVGADLSEVWPRFAVWILSDPDSGLLRVAKEDETISVIKAAISYHERRETEYYKTIPDLLPEELWNHSNFTFSTYRHQNADSVAKAAAYSVMSLRTVGYALKEVAESIAIFVARGDANDLSIAGGTLANEKKLNEYFACETAKETAKKELYRSWRRKLLEIIATSPKIDPNTCVQEPVNVGNSRQSILAITPIQQLLVLVGILSWLGLCVYESFANERLHRLLLEQSFDQHMEQIETTTFKKDATAAALALNMARSDAKELALMDTKFTHTIEDQVSTALGSATKDEPGMKKVLQADMLLMDAVFNLRLASQPLNVKRIARSGLLLAKTQIKLGQINNAQKTLDRILLLVKDVPSCADSYVQVLFELAVTYERESQLRIAQELLEKTLAFCTDQLSNSDDYDREVSLRHQLACIEKLADIDERLGFTEKALTLQKRAHVILNKHSWLAEEDDEYDVESGSN